MPVQAPVAARRPRVSREFVEMHRRRRFVEATAEILHEFGRSGATTTNVVRLAGGARNSFYELFRSVDDCIGYGIGLAEEELFGHLEELTGEDDWSAEVERGIARFYDAVVELPGIAELFLIHAHALRNEVGRDAYATAGERFIPLLRGGRTVAEERGCRPPSATVEETLSRSIVALAAARVRVRGGAGLGAESGPMAALVAGYYLGGDAAGISSSSRAISSPR
jgi:AcrR family transcriptional regulator